MHACGIYNEFVENIIQARNKICNDDVIIVFSDKITVQ